MNSQVFLCLCALTGVFGAETDEKEQVSVTEGEDVTFKTNVIVIGGKMGDQIIWFFEGNIIAQLKANYSPQHGLKFTPEYYGSFRDRLLLNLTTGDLTIKDVTSELSGLYSLQRIIIGKNSKKNFSLSANTHLPDPVRIVKIMDCKDENIYSCVVFNSSTNKTTQFNSTDLCQHSEENTSKNVWIVLGVVVLVAVLGWAVYCIHKKCRRAEQEGDSPGDIELHEDGSQNGTLRSQTLPQTNTPLMNDETNV